MKACLEVPQFDGHCPMTPEGADEIYEGVLYQRKAVIALGRRICASCDIQEPCREYGIATEQQYGLWGGLVPSEIRQEVLRRNGGDAA